MSQQSSRNYFGCTLLLVASMGTAGWLLVVGVDRARDAARACECQNNPFFMAYAMHNYHSATT